MAGFHTGTKRWNRKIRGVTAVVACLALGVAGCSQSGNTASPGSSKTSSPSGSTSPSGATSTSPSVRPSPSSAAATPSVPAAILARDGVGAPVTHPKCATPPSAFRPFKAPNKVVPDLAPLIRGMNHGPAANKWVYPAATVQKWVTKPSTAPKNKKIAFITFDDGPTPEVTHLELSNLEKAKVPATFFMITPQLQSVPASLLSRSLRDGNAVNIHSYSHDYHYLFNGDASQKEQHVVCDYDWAIAQARDVLGSGYFSSGFRYPGGHMSWHNLGPTDKALAARGVNWMDWNAESGDAEVKAPTTVSGMVAYLKQSMTEYGNSRVVVILDHDAGDKRLTAEAMPSIIAYLKKQGYQFGVMS